MEKGHIGFEHLILEKNKDISDINNQYNCLLYIATGEVKIQSDNYLKIIEAGEMFFVPKGLDVSISVIKKTDIIIHVLEYLSELDNSLANYETKAISSAGRLMLESIKMPEPIIHLITLLSMYIDEKILTEELIIIKQEELSILFRTLFSKQELLLFFCLRKNNNTQYFA